MSNKYSKGGVLWELLEEAPIIGELFEKLKYRSGGKGMKIFACFCLLLLPVIIVPIALIFLWLAKITLSLFKTDTIDVETWIHEGKNWINSIVPFDQLSNLLNLSGQWLQNLSHLMS